VSRFTSYIRYLSRRRHIKGILADLDGGEMDALRVKYRDARWNKYFDLQTYVPISVEFCQQLRLFGSQTQQILDVGCGTGLFLHCAQHFGHRGIGVDIEDELMGEMARLMKVERRIEPVRAFNPISVEGEFDLVTAMGTLFNLPNAKIGEGRWSCAEWGFFLADLERRLSPAGRVFLRINRGREARAQGLNYYDERVDQALGHGRLGGISYLFDRAALSRAIENLEQAERSLAPSAAADC
jgi:SAM-dependent methyltransferase